LFIVVNRTRSCVERALDGLLAIEQRLKGGDVNACSGLRWSVLAVAVALGTPVWGAQDTYPVRPVRFVVPFPAATPPDFLARIASQKLAESWNVPVIVEVHDGASGTIGVNQVVRAAPDGHTLLFTNDLSVAIAPALFKTPYDPRTDLAPVAMVAQGVSVLVVHPGTGIGSIRDLIAAAKATPGALTFASAGDASTSRMCMELIKQATGVELMQVPYKGAAPAIQAVLSGEVSMYCSPAFQALPHIKSGKLKAIGMTGAKRSSLIPDVQPMSAQGLPDATVFTWYAVFAPAGTPPAILGKIRDSLERAFDDAEVRQKLTGVGLDPYWMGETGLAATLRADLERWTSTVKAMGIKTQ
jgi:tripartite-type tricarboxylate transporter receptor subunit TctC